MTPQQEANEARSVEMFVEDTIRRVRKRGASAAVCVVLLSAARAAANMARRTATGAIHYPEADAIFRAAAKMMSADDVGPSSHAAPILNLVTED